MLCELTFPASLDRHSENNAQVEALCLQYNCILNFHLWEKNRFYWLQIDDSMREWFSTLIQSEHWPRQMKIKPAERWPGAKRGTFGAGAPVCDCNCHVDKVMHFMPCCELCYQKYPAWARKELGMHEPMLPPKRNDTKS